MKFSRTIHEEQIEIFPHITINIGYVDEFGNNCYDAVLIIIGWLVFDLFIEIPRSTNSI